MRRMIVTAVASAALAVPGIALASHQGEHQQREDHGVHHKRHHARQHRHHAHIVTFGTAASSAPSGTSSPAPTSPSSDEMAGTIASFDNGTLTIALKDRSTVSGKVTSFTEIECRASMAVAASDGGRGDENDQGDDRGRDGQSTSGPSQPASGQGQHSNSGPGNGGQDDGPGHDVGDDNGHDQAEHCTTAVLVPGAVVREAELSVSSDGSVWRKVELNS